MNINDLKLYDIVQIQSNDEWNGLYGIVDKINYNYQLAYIFCIEFPMYLYEIGLHNLGNIRMANFKLNRIIK